MTELGRGWDELIAQARRDGEAARGLLMEEHRGHLMRVAQQRLHGRLTVRLDPADAVQEAFLLAHRAFDQFLGDEEMAFRAWLERILENAITRAVRNHLLLQKRSLAREQPLGEPRADSAGPENQLDAGASTPSQRAMRREDEARLSRALELLPDAQRDAVRLRHLEGWPLAAIAARLGRTTVATAALVKRGMEALRKHLGEET
jgi:RNA polymerase sigma-70 factor (ECF subfamily)